MTLSGEGEYNLNILKEIEVTDSFSELDNEAKKCQSYKDKSTYDICTTRFFLEKMRLNCGCLPYSIMNKTIMNGKVSHCSSKEEISCLERTVQRTTPAECLRYKMC